MANENLPASLRFLTDAAHLLATAAPEASAHLMAQRNSLMFNNDLQQSDVQRQHVCGSCGHIMIAGQQSKLNMDTDKATRKHKKNKSSARKAEVPTFGLRKRFTCGMCGRYTDIVIPQPAPIARRRLKHLGRAHLADSSSDVKADSKAAVPKPSKSSAATTATALPTATTANASSKKRAKSRKQGLQALLQQSQASSSKPQMGLGLSLSDFMMK
ncbi:hypothetical protein F5B20DRAFT_326443 [Whalleya microplaca]|nr:hypothetical protein F5B20DRAFT_326443 [Whalleya microplaca]